MRRITVAALVVAFSCPLMFGLGLALSEFMPSCQWAASAPAGGCLLFGIDLNWLITASTIAFVGSFFSIPLGLAIAIIAVIVGRAQSRTEHAGQ